MMQRVLQRALRHVDRRIDWRVDRRLEEQFLPALPRQGESLAVLTEMSERLLFGMSELRRWMSDDLEAATETTVLLGESLARLQSAVEALGAEVATIGP
ncbi:MAG: hypothetical protein ACRD0O_19030, partial [Acidimicrobiia bacterium]